MAKTKTDRVASKEDKGGPKALPASFKASKTSAAAKTQPKGKDSRAKTDDQARPTPKADMQKLLKAFDLDMRYGPCAGLTREERWRRADKLGLKPPPEVQAALAGAAPTDPLQASAFSHL